ncbi:MAG: pentapeptide repeat-containing protein [Candidatus Riflebacteria bacterium]|nr:pentapeptide repeat-containing protein [Candidatus Riflebacteria bacterium]
MKKIGSLLIFFLFLLNLFHSSAYGETLDSDRKELIEAILEFQEPLFEANVPAITESNLKNISIPDLPIALNLDSFSISKVKQEPEKASALLSRMKIPLQKSWEGSVTIGKDNINGIFSNWQDGKEKYYSLKWPQKVNFLDNCIVKALGLPLSELPLIENFILQDLELIADLPGKQAIFFARVMVKNANFDIYLFNKKAFRLTPEKEKEKDKDKNQNSKGGDDKSSKPSILKPHQNFVLMVDCGAISIGDLVKSYTGFNLGECKVEDVMLCLSLNEFDVQVKDFGKVLQFPLLKLYGDPVSHLGFLKGFNILAGFDINKIPALGKILTDLNVSTSQNLGIQGSVGSWKETSEKKNNSNDDSKDSRNSKDSKDKKDSKDDEKETERGIELYLACKLPKWEFPPSWRKYFVQLSDVQSEFFLKIVHQAAAFGVSADFLTDLGSGKQKFTGGFELNKSDSDVGAGVFGKMEGILEAPFDIPIAVEDPTIKVTASPDSSYMFGLAGKTHIGKKIVNLGGSIKIQYTGQEAHPKAGALKAGCNSLKFSDLVDLANTMVAIKNKKWKPWEIPTQPFKTPDLIDLELEDAYFDFVTPGAADVDLGFNGPGATLMGNLKFQKNELGVIKGWVNSTGGSFKGKIRSFTYQDWSFNGALVDVGFGLYSPPHFEIYQSIEGMGDDAAIEASISPKSMSVRFSIPTKFKELVKLFVDPKIDNADIEKGILTVKGSAAILGTRTTFTGKGKADNFAISAEIPDQPNWKIPAKDLKCTVSFEKGTLMTQMSGTVLVGGQPLKVKGNVEQDSFILQLDGEQKLSFKDCSINCSSAEFTGKITGKELALKLGGKIEKNGISGGFLIKVSDSANLNFEVYSENIEIGNLFAKGNAEVKTVNNNVSVQFRISKSFDFSNLDFRKMDLRCLILESVKFCGAKLDEANLNDVSLKGSDLTNSSLVRCKIEGTNFSQACLKGADFKNASANEKTSFADATLENIKNLETVSNLDKVKDGKKALEDMFRSQKLNPPGFNIDLPKPDPEKLPNVQIKLPDPPIKLPDPPKPPRPRWP